MHDRSAECEKGRRISENDRSWGMRDVGESQVAKKRTKD